MLVCRYIHVTAVSQQLEAFLCNIVYLIIPVAYLIGVYTSYSARLVGEAKISYTHVTLDKLGYTVYRVL